MDIGILGTGKVGTDLLIKVLRSKKLNCTMFVGRNKASEGAKKAIELGVNVLFEGIDAFVDAPERCSLVFDATSADAHRQHAGIFKSLGIKVVDLTPAQVGPFCVPSINVDQILGSDNVNMVTCGGQASIPVLNVLSNICEDIEHVSVTSHLAEDSVGPATLANLDDYFDTTRSAICAFTSINCEAIDIDLRIEKSDWKPDMLTELKVHMPNADVKKIYKPLQERLDAMREFVPGYHIVGTPSERDGILDIVVSVRGQGDWIPAHAGNLDIINCAAISIAEHYSDYVSSSEVNGTGITQKLRNIFGRKDMGMETA